MPFKAFNKVHPNTAKQSALLSKTRRSQSALEYMMTPNGRKEISTEISGYGISIRSE